MRISILNINGTRKLPVIKQTESTECGLACIAMIASYHGFETDIASLRGRYSISMKGATLQTLIDISASIGLSAHAVKLDIDELKDIRLPAIIHWGMNHFVVLKSVSNSRFIIHDPDKGLISADTNYVSRNFTGIALELIPNKDFRRAREQKSLKLFELVNVNSTIIGGFFKVIVLSLIIELFVLASPFYFQMIIDESIAKGDLDFLNVIAICFGIILLFQVISSALRQFVIQYIGTYISFDTENRLFHHMLRLPLDWFSKRHVGDIQSRFKSIDPIKRFISGDSLASLIDGSISIFVVIAMLYYNYLLSALVLGFIFLYVIFRITALGLQRRLAGDVISTDAKKQSRFLESLRSILTVKSSSYEHHRERIQRGLIVENLHALIKSGNLRISTQAVTQLLLGLLSILVLYFGAHAVISNNMSLGMLTAFVSYQAIFVGRVSSFIDGYIQWRIVDVHLQRVSDIALSRREPQKIELGHSGVLQGRIAVDAISFRYSISDDFVINNLSFEVNAGEYLAISGASGCGKTTLVKLITGLYKSNKGAITIDGININRWNKKSLRQQIGIVLQDDVLLQGTIAENISGFDDNIDLDKVYLSAKQASIHQTIMNMPMAYHSLVGDMGTSLSGGQRQRIMIARALYRSPRLLILDEGTSNLDVETERAINHSLSELAITRIVIAHRPETLRAADRTIDLSNLNTS